MKGRTDSKRRQRGRLGIKVRLTRERVLRLTDAKTGSWLGTIRWRPRQEVLVELPLSTLKHVVERNNLSPKAECADEWADWPRQGPMQ